MRLNELLMKKDKITTGTILPTNQWLNGKQIFCLHQATTEVIPGTPDGYTEVSLPINVASIDIIRCDVYGRSYNSGLIPDVRVWCNDSQNKLRITSNATQGTAAYAFYFLLYFIYK